MLPDSTQSEMEKKVTKRKKSADSSNRSSKKTKKVKKNTKKTVKKGAEWDEESGNESDLDLTKVVKPIREYIYDRDEMTKQMFKALGNKKIKTMLPDILKDVPVAELFKLTVEQVEVMSKKRIRRLLDGADPGSISSSGTEDESSDDEGKRKGADDATSTNQQAADSTSTASPSKQEGAAPAGAMDADVDAVQVEGATSWESTEPGGATEATEEVQVEPPAEEEEKEEEEEEEGEVRDYEEDEDPAAVEDDPQVEKEDEEMGAAQAENEEEQEEEELKEIEEGEVEDPEGGDMEEEETRRSSGQASPVDSHGSGQNLSPQQHGSPAISICAEQDEKNESDHDAEDRGSIHGNQEETKAEHVAPSGGDEENQLSEEKVEEQEPTGEEGEIEEEEEEEEVEEEKVEEEEMESEEKIEKKEIKGEKGSAETIKNEGEEEEAEDGQKGEVEMAEKVEVKPPSTQAVVKKKDRVIVLKRPGPVAKEPVSVLQNKDLIKPKIPQLTKNQREILELEMRARAIKAMLKHAKE